MSDLLKLNITELSPMLAEKKISAAELTKAYNASIEKNEPRVGAYVSTNARRALDMAIAIDKRRAEGEELGVLAGIPMGVKEDRKSVV